MKRPVLQNRPADKVVMKRLIPAALLAAFLGCPGGVKTPAPCETGAAGNEYAVYSAAVEEFTSGRRGGGVVIFDRTEDTSASRAAAEWVARCETFVPEAERAVADDYREKNKHPVGLNRDFAVGGDYALVPEEDFEDVPADRMRLEGLAVKHPGAFGVVRLSRVGFDPGRTRAVVYVSQVACGLGCGEGVCMMLVREGCKWKVKDKGWVWMS